MKRRFLHFAACPIDHSDLELISWESRDVELSSVDLELAAECGVDPEEIKEEIISGVLLNRSRKIYYPIYNGVPRLLTFRTKVSEIFEEKFREKLREVCPEFSLPSEEPATGEADVLRSFSEEWVDYDWDGDTYWNLSAEDMFESMELMLDVKDRPFRNKQILEVGIGIGGIADHMTRSQRCELVGLDLSYAVDGAFTHFSRNPLMHIVQASAFAPPFKAETFDFVYSQGVIHHTYSTKTAFDNLSKLPKKDGRLYIWVYSPYDESRTLNRRVIMGMETVLRPVIWRLPTLLQNVCLLPLIPLYMVHQAAMVKTRADEKQVRYGPREALHAARDRFTPRYIHRHTDEEIMQWFEAAGYSDLQCASKRDLPEFVPESFRSCAGVDGFRSEI